MVQFTGAGLLTRNFSTVEVAVEWRRLATNISLPHCCDYGAHDDAHVHDY